MSSSDLFVYDGSDMASSDADHLQLYSDCLNPFPDSPIDILQAISDDSHRENLLDPINAPITTTTTATTTLLSSSPPSGQFQNLSLTHFQTLADSSNSPNGFADFSAFEVEKAENNRHHHHHHIAFESAINLSLYDENDVTMMQRSFSSNSFDGKPGFLLQSQFDNNLLNTPNLQTQETNFPNGHMRRVCSTGDLQNVIGTQASRWRSSSGHVVTEGSSSFMEEATNFKVGRYSAEERKERIHRYRAKRNQRNFNKTIKYACRKTLADNRPRIRGRFARNDEPIETPKPTCFYRYEDEDEIWIDRFHKVYENGTTRGEASFNSFGQTQFQYYTTTMAIDN